jgi:hypothetical protein
MSRPLLSLSLVPLAPVVMSLGCAPSPQPQGETETETSADAWAGCVYERAYDEDTDGSIDWEQTWAWHATATSSSGNARVTLKQTVWADGSALTEEDDYTDGGCQTHSSWEWSGAAGSGERWSAECDEHEQQLSKRTEALQDGAWVLDETETSENSYGPSGRLIHQLIVQEDAEGDSSTVESLYTYADDLLVLQEFLLDGEAWYQVEQDYDELGQRISAEIVLGPYFGSQEGVSYARYDYGYAAGELISEDFVSAYQGTDLSETWTRDELGRALVYETSSHSDGVGETWTTTWDGELDRALETLVDDHQDSSKDTVITHTYEGETWPWAGHTRWSRSDGSVDSASWAYACP